MSGAPLIRGNQIIGMATQFDNFGFHSYAVMRESMERLIVLYENGIRGSTLKEVSWNLNQNGLFRTWSQFCFSSGQCADIADDVMIQTPIGGGGVRTDSGDGGRIFNERTTPGLVVNGRHLLGFKLTPKDTAIYKKSVYIEASWATLLFLLQNQSDFTWQPVYEGEDLLKLVLNYLNIKEDQTTDSFFQISRMKDIGLNLVLSNPQEQHIWMNLPTPEMIKALQSTGVLSCQTCFVSTGINSKGGSSPEEMTYFPFRLIKTSSSNPNPTYYLDLRGLFFLDVSKINEIKHDSNSDFKSIYEAYLKGPVVAIRTFNIDQEDQWPLDFGFSLLQFRPEED